MVSIDECSVAEIHLSPGNCHDAPEGRVSIASLDRFEGMFLLMDRAYEGETVRACAVEHGLTPVVPPKTNRREKWDYDKQLYKKRNEVERLFRRLIQFRKVFTRYDKLDAIYLTVILFALIIIHLNSVNTP